MRRFQPIVLLVAFLAGCGYTFVGANPAIPGSIKRIYVAHVDAGEHDLLVADALSRGLRLEMRRHGRFVPVEERATADAVLEVRLIQDRTRSSGFDEFDDALAYDVFFLANASLRDRSGGSLWSRERIGLVRSHAALARTVVTSSSSFQGEERLDPRDLAAFDGVQVGEDRRLAVRRRMSDELARAIYRSMAEGF